MKICAILLDYRGAERTGACITSLLDQGMHCILVVDNSANADANRQLTEVIQNISSGAGKSIIKVIDAKANLGFSRGVNLALNDPLAHQCDYFLLINNDASATPGMTASLLSLLTQQHASLVAPTIQDEAGAVKKFMWYQRFTGVLTTFPLPFSFPYLSGCCLLFNRSLLVSNKLLDEDFFMYGEDTLLGWRLQCARQTMLQDEHAIIRHVGQGSSQKFSMFYEYHMARAHVLLALKTWHTRWEIPFLLLCKFFSLGMRALLRCMRARSPVPLAAFFLAWLPLKIRPQ